MAELGTNERFQRADAVISKVFLAAPANTHPEDVLHKVVVLNQLYSTRIYAVYAVAEHIVSLDIDGRLASGDPAVVEDIAAITIQGKARNNLSFASKYASWHQPEHYQIYDSLVDRIFWSYRSLYDFAVFKRCNLREYARYLEIHAIFKAFFGLEDFSRKELDVFLWFEAKQLEPRA